MSKLNRRALLSSASLAISTVFAQPVTARKKAPPLQFNAQFRPSSRALWYTSQASDWLSYLPLGNGRLGAMVSSGIKRETIQLNEDTFWSGGPYQSTRKDAHKNLKQVQDLIFAGKPLEAQVILEEHMMANPSRQMPFETLGELQIDFLNRSDESLIKGYQRALDLDTAKVTSVVKTQSTSYKHETFISAVDQVLVYRCEVSGPGHLDVIVGYERKSGVGLSTPDLKDGEPVRLEISGINHAAYGIDGKLNFYGAFEIVAPGARIISQGSHVEIRGAKSIEIRGNIATNFVSYNDVSGDPRKRVLTGLKNCRKKTFDALYADHLSDHQKLYKSFSLELGAPSQNFAASLPTDQRILKNNLSYDPDLAALLVNFGRYLLISCSRPGTQPANLQGLWNQEDSPIWGSKYTININTQMNYWAAEAVGLQSCVEPLVKLIRELSITGQAAAKDHWNAKGWCAHHNTDLWRAVGPIDRARSGYWPMGAGWLCQHLFTRWEYNQDKDYLRSIWPIMKGASQFFLDTLVTHPTHGYLVTCPSVSPENKTPQGTAICAGPSMDTQIIRDLFVKTAIVTETLGIENEFRDKLNASRAKLAPFKIGEAGQLQEWIDDWDLKVPDLNHRHISHLYALYPSNQISPEKTPELALAAKKTLALRGDMKTTGNSLEGMGDFGLRYGKSQTGDKETTGWGLAWRACLWSRLNDSERAFDSFARLAGSSRLQPNMFALHPPFQIDANFGAVAAMVEMLLRDDLHQIHLLPSLPKGFGDGRVTGLRARRNIVIDMSWRDQNLIEASLHSDLPLQTWIKYKGQQIALELGPDKKRLVKLNRLGRLSLV